MTTPKFPSTEEARQARWHSRRHETSDAHNEAREKYRNTRGRKARQQRALELRERQLKTYRRIKKGKIPMGFLRDDSPRSGNIDRAISKAHDDVKALKQTVGGEV